MLPKLYNFGNKRVECQSIKRLKNGPKVQNNTVKETESDVTKSIYFL